MSFLLFGVLLVSSFSFNFNPSKNVPLQLKETSLQKYTLALPLSRPSVSLVRTQMRYSNCDQVSAHAQCSSDVGFVFRINGNPQSATLKLFDSNGRLVQAIRFGNDLVSSLNVGYVPNVDTMVVAQIVAPEISMQNYQWNIEACNGGACISAPANMQLISQ